MKSLYVRVVLAFLGAALIGMLCSKFITFSLFKDSFSDHMESDMRMVGQEIIRLYGQSSSPDLDSFIRHFRLAEKNDISVYTDDGKVAHYGASGGEDRRSIAPDIVKRVLSGQESVNSGSPPNEFYVGLPAVFDGKRYAIFVSPAYSERDREARMIIDTQFAIGMAIGSVLIFIAARYVVQPLRMMTEATRRMAKGSFDIDWKWKTRKDEVGELARSFHDMAAELKQIEGMRQDFVSNVSHEIQSPLTSIAGFSKALRKDTLSAEERSRYFDIIETECKRLSRLSDNLLQLASLESNHHPFRPKTFLLDEQLRNVILACEPQWSVKAIEFDLSLPNLRIVGDEDQLGQVWMNLIGNAIKFTPEGGRIRVRIRPDPESVHVEISDTGIGISEEDQARIFDRFYKADRSRQRENGGSGLGLSIASRIVALHEGTIAVKSMPGKGTTFTVTLPSLISRKSPAS